MAQRLPGAELKFYRYRKGHRFGQHVDQSWKGDAPGHETEYTMLLYLNTAGPDAPPAGAAADGSPLIGGVTAMASDHTRTALELGATCCRVSDLPCVLLLSCLLK